MEWVGLFVGFMIVGPVVGWAVGMMNPIGWMGVPPWRVPKCECPADWHRPMHDSKTCPVAHPPR